MTTQADSADAYEPVRSRMTALLQQGGPDELTRQVPACPEWSVHDLLAHVTGLAVNVAAGRVEGAGSDAWTDAQVVVPHRGSSCDELLAEWAAAPIREPLLEMDEMRAAQVVFDLATHEHDLRGALPTSGERDSEGVLIGWGWATDVLGQLRDGYGEGALVLTTPHGATTCGCAPVTGEVTADRFELWRAMTARRSAEQVAAWDWTGQPAVERLCLLPARPTALQE